MPGRRVIRPARCGEDPGMDATAPTAETGARPRPRPAPAQASPMRSFDPAAVGRLEAKAWELYYRRRWTRFLVTSVRLVRAAFRMPWPATLHGAWLVLRANQAWAPFPDNDPVGARAIMARFYRRLSTSEGRPIDAVRAAELEVDWWRAHREAQHAGGSGSSPELVAALRDLNAFLYGTSPAAVEPAAALRAEAMGVSDDWVAAGCDPADPRLARARGLLVRSYGSLRAAVSA